MSFNITPHLQELTELRHLLHQKAEISGAESRTARIIRGFLTETNPDYLQAGIGGDGVLATYGGKEEGPHLLLRSELDALPVPDEIESSYRSETQGVGHKCGHDGHMAILCGVAKLLRDQRSGPGAVSLLFQPAEETGQGAGQVLEDKAFQALKPDYCYALHNLPGYDRHQVVIREGVIAAASVGMEVKLKGETAHAAHPEEGRSPAPAMAQLMHTLSSATQFYSPMDQPAKVTVVNAVLGGEGFGVSPGAATVRATLRTYDDDLLAFLQNRCRDIAGGVAETYGLLMDYGWVESFAATKNDPQAVDIIRRSAEKHKIDILEKDSPFSWSEDFGRFTREIPGALFCLGAGRQHPALHAENYDFPDEVIETGIIMFMQIIKEIQSRE